MGCRVHCKCVINAHGNLIKIVMGNPLITIMKYLYYQSCETLIQVMYMCHLNAYRFRSVKYTPPCIYGGSWLKRICAHFSDGCHSTACSTVTGLLSEGLCRRGYSPKTQLLAQFWAPTFAMRSVWSGGMGCSVPETGRTLVIMYQPLCPVLETLNGTYLSVSLNVCTYVATLLLPPWRSCTLLWTICRL